MSMATFEVLRSQLLDLAEDLRSTSLTDSLVRMVGNSTDDLMADCTVVTCGEFSRGKSSMLNALVERPGLFPVGLDVTTCVVTELRWGVQETAEVCYDEGSQVVAVPAVHDYITEQRRPLNAKDVRVVRLTAPAEITRPGMVLVDTPGIGSLNVGHAAATYAYLAKADAVLFVAAADERMSITELSYLATAITKCPVVITVLTKIDKIVEPGPENEMLAARDRIAQATGRDRKEIQITAVSARRKRTAIQTNDAERLRQSGFPWLEELLGNALAATWGKSRLNGTIEVLAEVIASIAAPVQNELVAFSSNEALKTVTADLTRTRARATELAGASTSWRRDLARTFKEQTDKIGMGLSAACTEIKEDFISGAHSDKALKEPEALVRETATRLVDAIDRAGAELYDTARRAAAAASESTRLPLTAMTGIPHIEVDLRLPTALLDRRHSAGLVESAFKAAAMGTGVGTAMGVAIGTLIFPGVGTLVGVVGGLAGQVVGLFAGLHDHFVKTGKERRTEQTELLTNLLLPRIERIIGEIESDFGTAIEMTKERLLAELDERIKIAHQSISESIQALEKLRTATEDERRIRYEGNMMKLAKINQFRDRLEILRTRTNLLG